MVRIATVEDAEVLLKLYSYYIEHTAVTYECTVPDIEEFRERIRTTLEKYPYLVYEANNRILGYAYAGPFNRREAAVWMVETSVYVHRNYGSRGIGKILYEELEEYLKKQNYLTMVACVTESQEANEYITKKSVEFHQHMGFERVGTIRKAACKFEYWYDLVFLKKQIGEYVTKPAKIITFPEICNDMTE